uniref:Uncharacterized protein n=1 Tax=Timema bartmani TaxID=61472 RepID=A0A7R9HZY2_9NEOP|nr:unnamed protein product [Timema bartmani]
MGQRRKDMLRCSPSLLLHPQRLRLRLVRNAGNLSTRRNHNFLMSIDVPTFVWRESGKTTLSTPDWSSSPDILVTVRSFERVHNMARAALILWQHIRRNSIFISCCEDP